jgi:hypothetical protein
LQRGRRRAASARATLLQPEEPWRATARPPWRPGHGSRRGPPRRVPHRVPHRVPGCPTSGPPKLPQGRAFRNAPRGPFVAVPRGGLFRPRGRRMRGVRPPQKGAAPPDETGPRPARANTVLAHKEYRSGPHIWRAMFLQNGQKISRALARPEGVAPHYRGAQQGLPGSPTRVAVSRPLRNPRNPHKQAERAAFSVPRDPSRDVPGCPTRITGVPNKTTGVPNKDYRGPQQKLPGSPTKTTGVPNKNYRGPQQEPLPKVPAKWGFFRPVSGPLCYCFSCSVMF